MCVALVAAFLLLVAGNVPAGLTWEAREIELRPAFGATNAKGSFSFTNAGSRPLTIASVESECGCTTVALEKEKYEPGEKGRITATFNLGERTGRQSKQVYVYVDGEKKPQVLTLIVQIADALKLAPSFVFWSAGAVPVSQTINLEAQGDEPLSVSKVLCSSEKYGLKVNAIREGHTYQLVVTPKNTEAEAIAILTIEVIVSGSSRIYHAYAEVKAAH